MVSLFPAFRFLTFYDIYFTCYNLEEMHIVHVWTYSKQKWFSIIVKPLKEI